MDQIKITGLQIFAHHGVFEEETKNGQNFYVNATLFVSMEKSGKSDELSDAVNYGSVCEFITTFLTEHAYKLLEKAVTETIIAVLNEFPLLDGMEMELCKPEAPIPLPFANVSVTRRMMWQKAYLSIGSNMGDSKGYLDMAVKTLIESEVIRKVKASDYLVTKPYGGVKQDDFLNGAVELETLLLPEGLLAFLHEIEAKANRKREIHWGPRTLDLDILFFEQMILDQADLTIPHADLQNREFVLKPLSQLTSTYRHPILRKTVGELLQELTDRT